LIINIGQEICIILCKSHTIGFISKSSECRVDGINKTNLYDNNFWKTDLIYSFRISVLGTYSLRKTLIINIGQEICIMLYKSYTIRFILRSFFQWYIFVTYNKILLTKLMVNDFLKLCGCMLKWSGGSISNYSRTYHDARNNWIHFFKKNRWHDIYWSLKYDCSYKSYRSGSN
jgi:hypothetical protein